MSCEAKKYTVINGRGMQLNLRSRLAHAFKHQHVKCTVQFISKHRWYFDNELRFLGVYEPL